MRAEDTTERHIGPEMHEMSTPRRLERAAANLFVEHGYLGTSIDEIVRAADLTKPTFYYHFDSKMALLTSILENSLRSIQEALEAAAESSSRPDERLKGLIRAYTLEVCDRPLLWTIYFAERKIVPLEIVGSWKAMEREMVKVFERVIEEGIADGSFKSCDSVVAAMAFLGMAGWAHHWFNRYGRLSPDEIADAFAEIGLSGLRPS